jgi:plasmid stabilization system protein ParE
MVRKVRWSSIAYQDFTATLKFYTDRNKSATYSRKLVKSIDKVINLLMVNPGLGRPTDDPLIRVYIKGNYKIYYETEGEEMIIQIFWDSRRNPDELKGYVR